MFSRFLLSIFLAGCAVGTAHGGSFPATLHCEALASAACPHGTECTLGKPFTFNILLDAKRIEAETFSDTVSSTLFRTYGTVKETLVNTRLDRVIWLVELPNGMPANPVWTGSIIELPTGDRPIGNNYILHCSNGPNTAIRG